MLELSQIKRVNSIDELRYSKADRMYIIFSDNVRKALELPELRDQLDFDGEYTKYYLAKITKAQMICKQLEDYRANTLFSHGPNVIALDANDFIFFEDQRSLEADLERLNSNDDWSVLAFEITDDVLNSILRSVKQDKLKFWLKQKSYYKDRVKEADKQIAELQEWLNYSKKEETK